MMSEKVLKYFFNTTPNPTFRLHTMFSLLSLKRAFVVTAGRLVGVVAVAELTKEIIGAAHSFNRDQRSESMSSLIPLYDVDNNLENESDDEDVIHDSSTNYRPVVGFIT